MNICKPYVLALVAIAAMICGPLYAIAKPPMRPQKLARPPKWPTNVLDVFYPDARTKLVGARPDYQHADAMAANASGFDTSKSKEKSAAGWSKLIDADTIETEIKRIAPDVGKATSSPSEFKGSGFKQCRRDFSVLAALFAVDGEYDGEVRWQDAAPALRDLFARAGHNCKAASDQTFQEAVQRKQDLADLIAGNRPKMAATADRKADWSTVADRPPLMQRLNIAHQDRLTKWLANKTEFAAHRDDAKLEAQLVATIADIIGREGYEYWDDESYAKCARDLRQAASEVSTAADSGNYERAQQASNRMTKACADCHEGFRG
ncbi:MAG TPA: hypothetical protein VFW73_06850 [Lacipirellulaceae bacterium]|nr:hypothetical protein [Lacipirellulaceae bacterium]